jgi:hypothetical protein
VSFSKGDIVKAARTIKVGDISIRIGSQGLVKNVVRKGLSKHYEVVWSSVTLTVAANMIVPTGSKGKLVD